ncbi:ABC transporter permease [Shinella sp. 838]|uniref:ABC transporter permease n=1 Tax=Shinella sp. 838 TaxID=3038164 RepID=UPI0024155F0D|nr:ABC transporter permease [Shinella sp. 838]MDG4674936.1 ABC transporter permease [Shinella sp. 838]
MRPTGVMAGKGWAPISIATLILCATLAVVSPAFLTVSNLQSVLIQSSVTGIMAVGMTFVIVAGGIDISIGAILFLTAALFAKLLFDHGSFLLAISIAGVSCASLGLINGLLVTSFRCPPLITTLATYSIYRGIAIHMTEAANIPVGREYGFIGNGKIFGLPVPILFLIAIAAIGTYVMTRTRFGIHVRAIGNSRRSAEETALPIIRVTIVTYVIAGVLAGLGAIMLIARVGGLQGNLGIGIEFTVIAATVLGGTKLAGGTGTILGSVIGAVFLVIIDNGLNLANASPFVYDLVRGCILLAAVVTDRASQIRQGRVRTAARQARVAARAMS